MGNAKTTQLSTFRISQLDEISNIDDKDLFLISDYEGGKCYTRKLTTKKLVNFIANNPYMISAILEDDQIEKKIDNKISSAVIDFQVINGGNAYGNT